MFYNLHTMRVKLVKQQKSQREQFLPLAAAGGWRKRTVGPEGLSTVCLEVGLS